MRIGTPGASGVTLIELLVTMVLLSLALAFVGPAVGAGLDNMTLRSTGRRLASAMRQAQSEARLRQETLAARVETGRIFFVATDGSVWIVDLNSTIRIGETGIEPTYLFFGSGHVAGPERLELENQRGRAGAVLLDASRGRIRFVEGE